MSEDQKDQAPLQTGKTFGLLAGRNVFGDATPALLPQSVPLEQAGEAGRTEAAGEAPAFELEEGDI